MRLKFRKKKSHSWLREVLNPSCTLETSGKLLPIHMPAPTQRVLFNWFVMNPKHQYSYKFPRHFLYEVRFENQELRA